jgi:hypothetical protein
MKLTRFLPAFALAATLSQAENLPVITVQPRNLSGSGTFSVVATNATAFQWRWNGTDIPSATNSTLPRSGSDPTGYYLVVVKNTTGWVPSQLAYLSRGSGGYVPFSNYGNPHWQARACYQLPASGNGGDPLLDGYAQVVAGPEVDQMQPVGDSWDFAWWHLVDPDMDGFFDMPDQLVPTVSPGQTVYYGVDLTYLTAYGWYTQPSRTLKLVAGGGASPTPSADDIRFPTWPEWPEPVWFGFNSTPTNQVRIPGETVSFTNCYWAYTDFGQPTAQWRKDGNIIPGATNFVGPAPPGGVYGTVFTITNLQPADAGIYDVLVVGNRSIIEPRITLTVQVVNGPGVFRSPRLQDTTFVSDLLGATTRRYVIQRSTNLLSWQDLLTVSNATGTVTFTNSFATDGQQFYRARLLP